MNAIELFRWDDAVLVLGENRPRPVAHAELVLNLDERDQPSYWLRLWSHDDADPDIHGRSIHRLIHVGEDGMRGRHDNCDGDIVVVPLNRKENHR